MRWKEQGDVHGGTKRREEGGGGRGDGRSREGEGGGEREGEEQEEGDDNCLTYLIAGLTSVSELWGAFELVNLILK